MSPDRRSFLLAGGAAVAGLATPALAAPDDDAKKFIADHEARIKPLEVAAGHAWWRANISGRDDDFKKKEEAQNAIDAALADRATFGRLRALKQAKDANQHRSEQVSQRLRTPSGGRGRARARRRLAHTRVCSHPAWR